MTATAAPPQTPSRPQDETVRIRAWLLGYLGFALLAAVGLAVPIGDLGVRILVLVLTFHVGVVAMARRTRDRVLMTAWAVLAPMSLLMVLPDWFLSAQVGSLVFPDTGGPFIGTVPLFMAGMWTIALLPVVLTGLVVGGRHGVTIGAATAAGVGFALFWAAEVAAPLIPLWEPVGVAMVGGIASYVIVPELVLSAAAYVIVATVGAIPRTATAALTALLPFAYLGMLATAYQFLG